MSAPEPTEPLKHGAWPAGCMSGMREACEFDIATTAYAALERYDGHVGGASVHRPATDESAARNWTWSAKERKAGPRERDVRRLLATLAGATTLLVLDEDVQPDPAPAAASESDAEQVDGSEADEADEATDGDESGSAKEQGDEVAADPAPPSQPTWLTAGWEGDSVAMTTVSGYPTSGDLAGWERTLGLSRAVEERRRVDITAPGQTSSVPVARLVEVSAGGTISGLAGLRPFEAAQRRASVMACDARHLAAVHRALRRRAGCEGQDAAAIQAGGTPSVKRGPRVNVRRGRR